MITVVAFHVKKITKPKTINKDIVGRCKFVFGSCLALRRAKTNLIHLPHKLQLIAKKTSKLFLNMLELVSNDSQQLSLSCQI